MFIFTFLNPAGSTLGRGIGFVNARESIRVTGGNVDWIYPGRNELTSCTID
jgi:hypothetical protein